MQTRKILTDKEKERLAALGSSEGAQGYAAYLGRRTTDAYDSMVSEAEDKARRQAVGYGRAGERLSAADLGNDGYAAYLRSAAKEARRARLSQLEEARHSEEREALRGYADYLDGIRRENGKELLATAEELLSAYHTAEEAEEKIKAADTGRGGEDALRELHRLHGPERGTVTESEKEAMRELLETLRQADLPYERNYEYCLLLGYSEEMARKMATYLYETRSDNTKKLHDLFTD